MHDEGILITVGSNFTNHWIVAGIGLHQELHLLSDAGISYAEIIKIASLNRAIALGKENKTGSIAVNQDADLVFLNDNLLNKIEKTQNIDFVLKDEKRYESHALNKHIQSISDKYY